MRTLLRKFLCALVFAGGMLGVSLAAPVQTATCAIGLGSICTAIGGSASAQTASAPMPVLYDTSPNGQYTDLDKAYTIMLHGPLVHFSAIITLLPVQNYTAGMTGQHTAMFYVGSYYNNPISAAFLLDVTITQKAVVWFKYNLRELTRNTAYPFTTRCDITLFSLADMNTTPSANASNSGFFDTVTYKNRTATRYYTFNATTSAIPVDPDIGLTVVAGATKATSLVTTTNSVTEATTPYVARSGNFWYFTDMPLSYIEPRDRYLVVCNMLYDILGASTPTLHRALMRLEGVNATTTVSSMQTLTDYVYSQKIPFLVVAIPVYTDPNGVYNDGMTQTIYTVNATSLKQVLNYARVRGEHILMHDYTYQHSNVPSVIDVVNANDYEFWLTTQSHPVSENSTQWAAGRLSAGLLELQFSGYFPSAREAPHYQSSPLATKAVPMCFKNTYQCIVYYTSDNPQTLAAITPDHDFSVGQFPPYIVQKDYYGQRVIPENLGNAEYNICLVDSSPCLIYSAMDILTSADYTLVVRDGFTLFLLHPSWLEPGLVTTGFPDFRQIITGITTPDYVWVDVNTVQ